MKKFTLTFAVLLFAAVQTMFSATINITISGFAYSPNATTANVGDVVTIQASTFHPLVQVDQSTWVANSNTPMSGGWGTQTANYTFTVTAGQAPAIYFVCQNHVSSNQMKGVIGVQTSGIAQTTAVAYSISLYPNPITGSEFTIKMDGYNGKDGKVLLYDEAGKLLETHSLTAESTTIKTKLPSGAYFYTVMVGTQPVYRNKFIVSLSK